MATDQAPQRQSLSKRKSDSQSRSEPPKKTKSGNKVLLRDHESFDQEQSINLVIGQKKPVALVEYLQLASQQCNAPLTELELHDIGSAIQDTTSFKKSRVLEQFPSFLESLVKNKRELITKSKENGSPHTLVITGAAIRAADIVRALRSYQSKSGSMVAKLFSKHIKLAESIDFCKSTNMIIGAGTPYRIYELLKDGALSTKELRRIVFDASHIDQKSRGLFSLNAITTDVMKLMGLQELKERYGKENGIELIFF